MPIRFWASAGSRQSVTPDAGASKRRPGPASLSLVYREVMLKVDEALAEMVPPQQISALGLQERAHLQEWVLAHPEIIEPGVTIITSEYGMWQTAAGEPVANRLDILGIDKDGRLVVVELKRGLAEGTVHMQAINYAAMVSRLSVDDVADLYVAYRAPETDIDPDGALTLLETQLLLTIDGIRRPRIVLIAGDFPSSVTASVVWLNEQQVDMSLIRYRLYQVNGQTIASFNQLFPVPDVEDFTIGRRQSLDTATSSNSAEPGDPWTLDALERLEPLLNDASKAMLDLCAQADSPINVAEVAAAAGVTPASVRGQLAGFTMRLRNPNNHFTQTDWPVESPGERAAPQTTRPPPALLHGGARSAAPHWRRKPTPTRPGLTPNGIHPPRYRRPGGAYGDPSFRSPDNPQAEGLAGDGVRTCVPGTPGPPRRTALTQPCAVIRPAT